MGQQDATGIGGDGGPLVEAIVLIDKSKKILGAYDDFRSSTVASWVDVSESVAQQHHALHLALDMCYNSRAVIVQDPSVINLINALETAVLANADITGKVTEFLKDLETLSKRMDDIG